MLTCVDHPPSVGDRTDSHQVEKREEAHPLDETLDPAKLPIKGNIEACVWVCVWRVCGFEKEVLLVGGIRIAKPNEIFPKPSERQPVT